MKSKLALFFGLFLVLFNQNKFAQETKYLSFPEIMKVLTESKVIYNIKSIEELDSIKVEDFNKYLFPQYAQHVEQPYIIKGENGTIVTSWPLDSLSLLEISEGEKYFFEKDYGKALEHYQEALKIDSDLYVANLYLGDSFLQMEMPDLALEEYKKAIDLNPNDYKCFMFSSSAYVKMHEMDEALDNYITALVLKPNHANIIKILNAYKGAFDIDLVDMSFNPKCLFLENKGEFDIYYNNEDHSVWMPYIITKAMLKGETEVKESIVGSNSFWSVREEKQALLSLLGAYTNQKDKEDGETIEYFEKLLKILKDGKIEQFIIYEIGSKLYPDIVLQLSDEQKEGIEDYIRSYIIVKK